MSARSEPLAVPETLGPYRCLRKLAVGGMGEVFLAEATGAGAFKKRLVIKAVRADRADEKDIIQAFLDEARIWALLTHPNIVPLFDCVWLEGRLCLVMEYIEGADLRELIQAAQEQKRSIHAGVVIHIIAQLAAALHAAHEARGSDGKLLGIVHRDVSPHNLLIDRQVNARLCDFGIARSAVRQNRTRTGRFKGKFAYVAPEAIRGESLDRRADVFGMGVMLYELLALERPFRADAPLPLLRIILEKDPPPLNRPGLSHQLAEVVNRALSKELGARFPTAEAFRLALLSTPEAYPAPSETQLISWFDALTGMTEEEPSTEPRFLDLASRAAARSIDDEVGEVDDPYTPLSASSISFELEPPVRNLGALTGEVTLPRQKAPEPPASRQKPSEPVVAGPRVSTSERVVQVVDRPADRSAERSPDRSPERGPPPPPPVPSLSMDQFRTASTAVRGPPLPTRDYDAIATVLREPSATLRGPPQPRGNPWARRLFELWPYVLGGAIFGTVLIWSINHYFR